MSTAIFYSNFSKRKNSTKQPTGGTSKSIVLKNNVSLEKPVFEVDGVDLSYNYVQWQDNYYFITDIVILTNRKSEIHCEPDILATYKSSIGSYTAFVRRSASSYDDMINDGLITAKQEIAQTVYTEVFCPIFSSTGFFLLRVVGKDGICNYRCTYSQIFSSVGVFGWLYDDANVLVDLVNNLNNTIFNPFQYVLSLMWFPIEPSLITGTVDVPTLGWWTTSGVAAYKLSDSNMSYTFSVNISRTVLSSSDYYGDFRDFSSQWTQVQVFIPCYGMYSLDPIFLNNDIVATYYVDLNTGQVNIILESGEEITNLTGMIGVPVQISSSAVNGTAAVSSVITGIGAVAAGIATGGAGGAAAAALGATGAGVGVGSAIANPITSVNGQNGNKSMLINKPDLRINIQRFATNGIPASVSGRPLMQNILISSLSGYIQCDNASVPIAGFSDEKDTVNNYLNSGFYYE